MCKAVFADRVRNSTARRGPGAMPRGIARFAPALAIPAILLAGCGGLSEIRHKNAIGEEFRESSDRTSIQQGIELSFENGVKTGVSYRYRFNDDDSDPENGVWLEVSYPLWKKKKK